MKLSIVILSWNDRKLVCQAVQSILDNCRDIDYEVIVIDNASRDDSVTALQQFGDRVRLISNPTNRGYAGGNNQGWQEARGDYVLLLNQDVIMPEHTIAAMLQWLEQNAEYGAATVTLRYPDGRLQYYMHRRFPTLPALFGAAIHKRWPKFQPPAVRHYLYLDNNFDRDFDIEQAAGTCIMLRRSAIEQLGVLFDAKHFPLYYNDVDLCRRLWQKDWKIRCLTSVYLTHYKGTSVRRVPKWSNTKIYLKALWYYFLRTSLGLK